MRHRSLLLESKQGALIKNNQASKQQKQKIDKWGCRQIVKIEICPIDTGKVMLTEIDI